MLPRMNFQPERNPYKAECGCQTRREFLRALGFGAGAVALQPWEAMAGPFTRADFEKLVPADKKLRPEWVRSLTERGQRTVYRGAELEKIGMPIGGLCAGQLYLGGDGQLWHWDIFNRHIGTGAQHYAQPMTASSPLVQGLAVKVSAGTSIEVRSLARGHWRDISFIGEYPIGFVDYRDPACPVSVSLEAFSPFIPLETQDSSLPATVLECTVHNHGKSTADVELVGWLENAVCLHTAERHELLRRNRIARNERLLLVEASAEAAPSAEHAPRPDILFEDFETDTYRNWTATGTAFGLGPAEFSAVPSYQGDLAGLGKRAVNSHASAPGRSVEEKDSARGTLTSRPFVVERNYITFLIGGGAHARKTCINLLIENKVVLSATGRNDNHMQPASWNVRSWTGKTAVLQIVDDESGAWGNIGIDQIVFSDRPGAPELPLGAEPDFGTLALALLEPGRTDEAFSKLAGQELPDAAFAGQRGESASAPFQEKLVGSVLRRMRLRPGASGKAIFLLSWHMPNLRMRGLPPGRHYATRFASARSVSEYVAANFARLAGHTRLWHRTWYDSTLPYWFLDRTFLNTSILASSTCYRFGNGRFYGWEGVGCCEGTCGHVWQYAHAPAHLFPDLERMTREKVDFGLALQPDGAIHFRGEFNDIPAIDAQAGAILRAMREHRMSSDDTFLRRNWPAIKKATQWLVAKDGDGDGLIAGNQHNTLDTDWFGPVAWLSGLYLAALSAAETMATLVGDSEFASKCGAILGAGQRSLLARLFDGEYFINLPDPKHLEAINSGSGCEIDQVMGQGWAFQAGLPRLLPEKETVSALRSLWRYNFTPDVGPYRRVYKPGRWYAMPGEAGLLMCTFPRADWDYQQAKGKGPEWAAGYFNECMNGFEYQVAGHMLWEGLVTEGLAVTRAVHDRYHAARRNPWNEIECGDHYARSMASYGVFLAACGFEYDGPRGDLALAPRIIEPSAAASAPPATSVGRFKAAFTTAEGWGTYEQNFRLAPARHSRANTSRRTGEVVLELKWGNLRLRTLGIALPEPMRATSVRVVLNGRRVRGTPSQAGKRLTLTLTPALTLRVSDKLQVQIT